MSTGRFKFIKRGFVFQASQHLRAESRGFSASSVDLSSRTSNWVYPCCHLKYYPLLLLFGYFSCNLFSSHQLSPWMVLTKVELLPDEIRKLSLVICHGLCTRAECTFQVVFWWLHRMCSKSSYMKYWLSEVQRHSSPLRRATFPLHSTAGRSTSPAGFSCWLIPSVPTSRLDFDRI